MWSLAGSQAIDQPIQPLWAWVSQAGRSVLLGLWVEQLASAPDAHPPEVSGVGPQSANLCACNRASGECWGCLSHIHSPGVEGGGTPGAAAAAKSYLTSPWVPLFSFSFWEIIPIQAPLVQTSTWLLTAQPGSLPRILQQPLRPGWGFCRPCPHAGPGSRGPYCP